MANISAIELPNGTTYNLRDNVSGYITGITKSMVTTALGTGSGTTKFLREDGTWATPAYIANTDTKLQVAEVTNNTQYYPLVGTGTTAATRQFDTGGFKYKGSNGTTSAIGTATLELGNATASGTANNKQGVLRLYNSESNYIDIKATAGANNWQFFLPLGNGTAYNDKYNLVGAYSVDAAVGSMTKPVYIAQGGLVKECTNSIPTKVSELTNDSNFISSITKSMVTTALGTGSGTTKFLREDGSWATPAYIANTDAKLQVAEVTSGTTYYPLVGTGTTAATRQYDTKGFGYIGTAGTTSTEGTALLALGNATASGTANNKYGILRFWGKASNYIQLAPGSPTANYTLTLPSKTGTLAVISDIPTQLSELSGTVSTSQIANNAVTASKIADHSVGATTLAVNDNTNIALVNEAFEASLTPQGAISDGYMTKNTATSQYIFLTDAIHNSFDTGDELYYEFYGKAATAGNVILAAWGYDSDYTLLGSNYVTISLTTTEQLFSGTLKLSDTNWDTATFYRIGFNDQRSTKSQIYVKKVIIRRKPYTEGASGYWHWRKWPGGKTEAWFNGVIAGQATTQVGQVHNFTYSLSIPSGIFTAAPYINLSLAESTNTVMGINGGASSATAISGRVFRAASTTSATNYRVTIYAWQD